MGVGGRMVRARKKKPPDHRGGRGVSGEVRIAYLRAQPCHGHPGDASPPNPRGHQIEAWGVSWVPDENHMVRGISRRPAFFFWIPAELEAEKPEPPERYTDRDLDGQGEEL